MKNKVLHTEWGTAKLQKTGYYRITSKKEDNCILNLQLKSETH